MNAREDSVLEPLAMLTVNSVLATGSSQATMSTSATPPVVDNEDNASYGTPTGQDKWWLGGAVSITDPIAELNHLFIGSGNLPDSFGSCDADPTVDGLGCSGFERCQDQ